MLFVRWPKRIIALNSVNARAHISFYYEIIYARDGGDARGKNYHLGGKLHILSHFFDNGCENSYEQEQIGDDGRIIFICSWVERYA